ncbi:DUF1559 domain-containing protein [Tautonia sp. JC769]|uniref:DUF1559 family PulG-like putative transporter n=1 Tax=Tautonia sp. JC769 TaxID=3232135 RepID=UPI003457EE3C
MNPNLRVKTGFTAIEALVVVAIVGLLFALLLPAVQFAREASRRSACANNLRQIGVAIQQYEGTTGVLPPGSNGLRAYSAHAMILPYIEELPIFNSINFSSFPQESNRSNRTSIYSKINLFTCPSQPALEMPNVPGVNYAGNTGISSLKPNLEGLFSQGRNQAITFSSIRDGMNATIMFSEITSGYVQNSQSSFRHRVVFSTIGVYSGDDWPGDLLRECNSMDINSQSQISAKKGGYWIKGDYSETLYNHLNNPKLNSCKNQSLVDSGIWTAGSEHGPFVHSLFADGHVSRISENIDPSIWKAIGTRSGGELVSEDF